MRSMTGSAARSGAPASLKVAPDLAKHLARFKRVPMPFRTTGLTTREQQMVRKLVEACGYLESIYWRQSDSDGLTLYQSLASSRNRRDIELRRYLWINASRFDLLDDNKPFVGTEPMPPGQGFYPANLTREKLEQYVRQHPEQKTAIYDPLTTVANPNTAGAYLRTPFPNNIIPTSRIPRFSRAGGQGLTASGQPEHRSCICEISPAAG